MFPTLSHYYIHTWTRDDVLMAFVARSKKYEFGHPMFPTLYSHGPG